MSYTVQKQSGLSYISLGLIKIQAGSLVLEAPLPCLYVCTLTADTPPSHRDAPAPRALPPGPRQPSAASTRSAPQRRPAAAPRAAARDAPPCTERGAQSGTRRPRGQVSGARRKAAGSGGSPSGEAAVSSGGGGGRCARPQSGGSSPTVAQRRRRPAGAARCGCVGYNGGARLVDSVRTCGCVARSGRRRRLEMRRMLPGVEAGRAALREGLPGRSEGGRSSVPGAFGGGSAERLEPLLRGCGAARGSSPERRRRPQLLGAGARVAAGRRAPRSLPHGAELRRPRCGDGACASRGLCGTPGRGVCCRPPQMAAR